MAMAMKEVPQVTPQNWGKTCVLLTMVAGTTWRIIPLSKSPKDRVIPLTNGRTLWLINGGDPNHLQVLGAHPPSTYKSILGGFFLQASESAEIWKKITTRMR